MRQLLILALLIALGYLIWRLTSAGSRTPSDRRHTTPGTHAEEMVQDPACQLYLPRSEAIRQNIRGRDYYFCSSGCLERFLTTRT